MIRCRYIANPLDPRSAEVSVQDWREGLTVADVAPSSAPHVVAYRWGRAIERAAWGDPVQPGESLDFVAAPTGIFEGITLTKFLIGLAQVAAAVAINFVVQKLLGPGKPPLTEEDQTSQTYRFGGIRNNPNAENAPIPVVYGEHDAGGLEIVKYVQANGTGDELNVLLLLSEGPVEAVGGLTEDADNLRAIDGNLPEGLKINGQPAGNFDDITCSIRLGTDEQQPISGFADSVVQVSVAQTLVESVTPGPDAVELAEGTLTPGVDDAEIEKWDTAVTYDMATEADAARIVLNAPNGLYASDSSSADLLTNTVTYQARYIELDSSDSPIGDYVVLPSQTLSAASSAPITSEYSFSFFDPAVYVPPVPGNAQRVFNNDTGTTWSTSSPAVGLFASTVPTTVELTVAFTARGITRDASDTPSAEIAIQVDDGDTGFRVRLRNGVIPFFKSRPFSFATIAGGVVTDEISDSTASFDFLKNTSDIWLHYAVTYTFDPAIQNGRVRFYENGNLLGSVDVDAVSLPTSPNVSILVDTGPTFNVAGPVDLDIVPYIDMDDVRIFQRALSGAEIAGLYNSGQFTANTGDAPDQVLGYTFQTGTLENLSAVAATATGGVSSTVGGITPNQSSGLSVKRSKYRIEVQRLNGEDTDQLSQDRVDVEAISLVSFETFRYPGCALLAMQIRATDQLNGGPPTITIPVKGRRCPIWDGFSTTNPTYFNSWTRNPAWIALDALTNTEYGLGDVHDPATDIDVGAFREWADFCDEKVPSGKLSYSLDQFTSYSASLVDGVVTLAFGGGTSAVPPSMKAGDLIALVDTLMLGTNWDTPDGVAIEVTTVNFDPSLDTLTIVGNWGFATPAVSTSSGSLSPTLGKKIEFREPRFVYDGVFDRPNVAGWDSVIEIFQSARAMPVRYGNRVSVVIDRARDPVALVTMGNIVPGSFRSTYSGIKDRPNAVAIEILDREDNYQRKLIEREHPTLTDPANEESFRRRRIRREGVTRRSQALREAVYQLNVAFLLRRLVEFELDIDGLLLQPGDRVQVSHDVPQWGFSGRVRGGTTTTVQLDRPVTIETDTTYEVIVQSSTTGQIDTSTVTSAADDYAAGASLTMSAMAFAPQAGDRYSFGGTAAAIKDFIVTNVDLDTDTLRRKVQAIEYNSGVYDDAFGEILESPSALPVPTAGDLIPNGPFGLTATEGADENQDGTATQFIQVAWQNDPETRTYLSATEVWVRRESNGVLFKAGETGGREESFRVMSSELKRGETYTVFARPRGRSRNARPVLASAAASVELRGLVAPPAPPTGLRMADVGERAAYAWLAPADRRARQVEVRAGGWLLGRFLGRADAKGGIIEPTDAWVHADPPLPIYARTRSDSEQWSEVVSTTDQKLDTGYLTERSDLPIGGVSWTGITLSDMEVDGAAIKFSGSATSGYVEVTGTIGANEPTWAHLDCGWEAEQIHPATWDDWTWAWDSIEGSRWTWEGPTTLLAGESRCGVRVEIATSQGSSADPADLALGRFGPRYLKSYLIRIGFTRPNTDYDVRLRRLYVATHVPYVRSAKVIEDQLASLTPRDGDRVYITDADDWATYDATREKWLGDNVHQFSFMVLSSGSNFYLTFDDLSFPASATLGYVAPFDLVVVGLTGKMALSTTNTMEVRDDGSTVASVVNTATTTTRDMTLNSATVAAGSVIALYSNGSLAASHFIVYARRVFA